MGHHHSHHHHHHGNKNILFAFFLNAGFAVIEFIGGYLTNSVAIYSDALHDLGDSFALLFSYFAEKASTKQADAKFTFGYRRFSILSGFINGIILLLGSIFVIYEAVHRMLDPQPVHAEGMLALAVLGVVVNSIAAYRLSKDKGINIQMIMYHLLEDILGWISVLIVAIILMFKPWYILDSILSVLISLIILRGVYKNMLRSSLILLQRFPDDLALTKIKGEILSLEQVIDVHAIKGWSLDESNYYLRFHVVLPGEMRLKEMDCYKDQIKEILKRYQVTSSTIEFESNRSDDCEVD